MGPSDHLAAREVAVDRVVYVHDMGVRVYVEDECVPAMIVRSGEDDEPSPIGGRCTYKLRRRWYGWEHTEIVLSGEFRGAHDTRDGRYRLELYTDATCAANPVTMDCFTPALVVRALTLPADEVRWTAQGIATIFADAGAFLKQTLGMHGGMSFVDLAVRGQKRSLQIRLHREADR